MTTAPVLMTALPAITLTVLRRAHRCIVGCGALGLTVEWLILPSLAVRHSVAHREEKSGAPTKCANRASPEVLQLVLLCSPWSVMLRHRLSGVPVRFVGTLNA